MNIFEPLNEILVPIAYMSTEDSAEPAHEDSDVFSYSCRLLKAFYACTQCCLLLTFANSLDPDQARPNVGPDLDPICLILLK